MFKKIFLLFLTATIILSACGTFEVSINQIQTPTAPAGDPTKIALEIEATSMSAFVTQQAATLWPPPPAPTVTDISGTPDTPTPQPPPGLVQPIVVYPPYDSPTGYLLGGSQNGMWLDSGATAVLLEGGEQYGIYTDKAFLYTVTGSAPAQNPPYCPAMQAIALDPKPSPASVVAIGGSWNALPRIPQELSTENDSYRQVIGDMLRANGLVQSDILLTRVLKVDLEGDGTDEVLISASRFSDESGHDVSSGDYSLIVLRKVAGNTAITIPMVTYYYLESQLLAYPNKYTLSAVMDLNGDGRMEILVGITGWEKVGTLGYEVDQSAVRNILDVRCP